MILRKSNQKQGPKKITFSQFSQQVDQFDVEKLLQELRLVINLDGEHFQLKAVDYFKKIPQYKMVK